MELQVLRRVQPFQTIVVLPQGQQGARGQVIHLPADRGENLAQLLPLRPQDTIILVKQQKPSLSRTISYTVVWKLRVEKVMQALSFLMANNPRYTNITL